MIVPLIISIVTALLCCGCLGFFFWQMGQVLAGDTGWAEASCPLVLSQMGVLFFGVFAIGTWKYYRDQSTESRPLAYMIFALFLEVALLLGVKTGIDIHDRIVLLDEGVETQAVITGRKRTGSGRNRSSKPLYQFTTPDGRKIKGSISFEMSLSLPVGENVRYSVSSNDVTYRIGSTVPVLYMANDPEHHVVWTFGEVWCAPFLMGVLSLTLIGVTGFQIYKMHKRPAGRSRRLSRRRRR
jgi:hypothetical protein